VQAAKMEKSKFCWHKNEEMMLAVLMIQRATRVLFDRMALQGLQV
jgi:hypothetical protein